MQELANILARVPDSEVDFDQGPHKYLQRKSVPQTYSKTPKKS